MPDYTTLGAWSLISTVSLLIYFTIIAFMMVFNMLRKEKAAVLASIFLASGAAICIFFVTHLILSVFGYFKLVPIFAAAFWLCQIVVLTKYRGAFFAIFGKDVHQ